MSNLDDMMNAAHDEVDAVMGVKSMVVSTQTFNVVWNNDTLSLDGIDGGLDSVVSATAVAQPADVTTPKALEGLRCTVGGTAYRIDRVIVGDVAIEFSLVDAESVS